MRATGPRLRDLGRWCSGGTPPKDRPELWSGDVPWISGKDFDGTRLRVAADRISREAARAFSATAPAGSLALLVRGMALVHGLPVALLPEAMAINQDVRAVVLRPEFDPRFVHYAMIAARPRLGAHIDRAAHGTARFVESGYSVRLADPRAVDQTSIADFLDRECERIEAVLRASERISSLLSGSYEESVGATLTREAETYSAYGRSLSRLRFMIVLNEGGAWGEDQPGSRTEEVEVLRSTEIAQDGTWLADSAPALRNLHPQEARATSLRQGDLLVTKSSGSLEHIGKTALVDAEHAGKGYSNFIQRIRPAPSLDPLFAWHLLNSRTAREHHERESKTTSGLVNLNARLIGDLRVPIPDLARQRILAAEWERTRAVVSRGMALVVALRELLTEYRDALITEAVTGQLDVTKLSAAQLDESARAAAEGEAPEVLAG